VVLRYEACLSGEVPVIPLPCSDDHDGLAASRLRDSFRLCLEAEAPPDPYATVRDISRRTGWGGRPWSPRRFDRWRAPDGTIWIYDQPRNPDGTYRSDDLSTLQRESALGWQVVRPGSAAGVAPWQGSRQLLLDHALNAPIAGLPIAPGPLERFWSGADDAALLLATLDLEAGRVSANAELQRVQLVPATPAVSNPDNSVRAVLPAVQAVSDLAFGIRLEGPASITRAQFQAVAVSALSLDSSRQPTISGPAEATLIEVRLSLPIAADPAELARGIRLLHKPATSGRWQTVRPDEIRAGSTAQGPSVQLLVKPAWTSPTPFQVVLSGTGPTALLSKGQRPQPLAGVAGEIVPPGSGRDAHLFGTYTPPTP
jgi:hypothetical protein